MPTPDETSKVVKLCFAASVLAASSGCGGRATVILGDDPGASTGDTIDARALDMIDDMEDNNQRILLRNGRNGGWNTYNDGSADTMQWPTAMGFFVMSAVSPPRGSSSYAARTYGRGLLPSTGWATLTLNFVNAPAAGESNADGGIEGGLPADVYDASAYAGITFFARVAPDAQTTIRVSISDLNTNLKGGICKVCYDAFGSNLLMTADWARYKISFAEMMQRAFGDPFPALDAAHVFAIDFSFIGTEAFDLWVDDVAFYR